MNKLSRDKQVQIVAAIVEGVGINAISRMTGVAKNTILSLLAKVGMACAEYQDRVLVNLDCRRLQADECWQFCYAKDKNLPADKQGKFGFGSVWTWTAIDADTKLAPCFLVGNRDAVSARMFIDDLASRLRNRIQLTTDGLKVYLEAAQAGINFLALRRLRVYTRLPAVGPSEHKIFSQMVPPASSRLFRVPKARWPGFQNHLFATTLHSWGIAEPFFLSATACAIPPVATTPRSAPTYWQTAAASDGSLPTGASSSERA